MKSTRLQDATMRPVVDKRVWKIIRNEYLFREGHK
jgi:hypothetical protein